MNLKLHLLSARGKGPLVSTRWISAQDVIYELILKGKFDGDVITTELGTVAEVLYVPPYGTSVIEVDLAEAKTTTGSTRRGDTLVKIIGGSVTINDISIKRRPSVPRLISEIKESDKEVQVEV